MLTIWKAASTNSSIPEIAINDRDHKQDWTKTTSEKDSWAYQERRRLSGWSNTDVATHKYIDGRRGSVRRASNLSEPSGGSILSMWKGGKDAKGNDIIGHDDEEWAR